MTNLEAIGSSADRALAYRDAAKCRVCSFNCVEEPSVLPAVLKKYCREGMTHWLKCRASTLELTEKDKGDEMTNYEKIIEGGQEAMAHVLAGARFWDHLIPYGAAKKQAREWLNQTAKPMMTDEETAYVSWALEFGFEWAATDKNEALYFFVNRPVKDGNVWKGLAPSATYGYHVRAKSQYLKFIKWEDSEPTELRKLI
jgi:hypothetical protein